jgi:two-component system, OmpR family, sensor histidine kinase KdpD
MHAMQSTEATSARHKRDIAGVLVALGGLGALTAVMLPWRSHLSIATPALVFIIPVLLGAIVGGMGPGAVGSLAGFLLYDIFFVPPYGKLTVQAPDNWISLIVYVVVVLVVTRIVTKLQQARQEARRREEDAGRLYEFSRTLIGDLSPVQLLNQITATVQEVFAPRWTVLLLPAEVAGSEGADLMVAASAGDALTSDDLASLTGHSGQIRSLGMMGGETPSRVAVALVAGNRPVGMLVLHQVQFVARDRELLGTFANQAALAVERAQLQDQALRSRLLEEIDRWRGAMMGAVSHDLRTPLGSVKAAVSSLRQDRANLGAEDQAELLELIELQSDRLARLVTNLLDMTRIESGALTLRPSIIPFDELVREALDAVSGLVPSNRVSVTTPPDLPPFEIDHVLIVQVLANLLENAARLAPGESPIRVEALAVEGPAVPSIEISVADDGPGIATEDREKVFEMFSQNSGGGRAGLGLFIAKAFVEAHGGTIWIDPHVTLGARVVFTLPRQAHVAVPA